jgi:hypothetical protein
MKTIPLTKGKFTIVDDDDYEYLNQWKWCVDTWGYAVRSLSARYPHKGKSKGSVSMHRVILDANIGQQVDHADLDKLNNQKYNLRFCTSRENKINRRLFKNNTTGHKGVYRRYGKFFAAICIDYKLRHLGTFETAADAANKYKEEAEKYHGDFIRLT